MDQLLNDLSANGLHRLSAIKRIEEGERVRAVADAFGVHHVTILNWLRLYEQGDIPGLNAPFRPCPVHRLDVAALEATMSRVSERYRSRWQRLLRLARGERLNEIAASSGVSVQAIMKDRRLYTAGKLKR